MSAHSPGPWHYSEHEHVGVPDGIFDQKGHCIAFGIATPQPFEVREVDLANARLMTASPDLLKALKALDAAGFFSHTCKGNTCTDASHIARAAIAKAEG